MVHISGVLRDSEAEEDRQRAEGRAGCDGNFCCDGNIRLVSAGGGSGSSLPSCGLLFQCIKRSR
jgi:hypothetical protein